MIKLTFTLVTMFLLIGCFHKSVENTEADNIYNVKIFKYNGRLYFVALESVFQATSKKSGQEISITKGSSDMRISVYDMSNGSLISRIATGNQKDHAIVLFGYSEGNIWFYSIDDGLHSRSPETLEIKVSQNDFFEKNPNLKNKLTKCDWFKLGQFFKFNELSGMLLISDDQGYSYSVDPSSLVAVKIKPNLKEKTDKPSDIIDVNAILAKNLPDNMLNHYNIVGPFETSIAFKEKTMTLKGDVRKQIILGETEVNPEITFLDGKFIADRDTNKENANSNDVLLQTQLLSTDSNSFFVFHKSNTSKDALVIISKLEIKNKSTMKELWQLTLPDFFFDPSAAIETDSFKKVFSKGSPDFSFSYIELTNNRLLVIYMLYAHCIDVNSGKILWQFKF